MMSGNAWCQSCPKTQKWYQYVGQCSGCPGKTCYVVDTTRTLPDVLTSHLSFHAYVISSIIGHHFCIIPYLECPLECWQVFLPGRKLHGTDLSDSDSSLQIARWFLFFPPRDQQHFLPKNCISIPDLTDKDELIRESLVIAELPVILTQTHSFCTNKRQSKQVTDTLSAFKRLISQSWNQSSSDAACKENPGLKR